MERTVRERYEPLLQSYRLHAEHIEEYGSVVKVHTNQGAYALKKLEPSRLERSNFMQHLQLLAEKGFTNFAPIYHNGIGEYILSDSEYRYYLMPWLEAHAQGEENDEYHKMFQTLASMHQKTLREEKLTEDVLNNHYDTLSGIWERERNAMEEFVVNCESRWYMSPFELQYCTYFHQAIRAHEFASKKLEEWHEAMKEQETTRIALIHGNLSMNHFLFDHEQNGYFISLERSQFSTPVQDLVQFYSRSFQTYPIARNDRYEWFQVYQKNFPFTPEEKKLMLAYLAYPRLFTKQVATYAAQPSRNDRNERESVTQLQQVHWLINNTEFFVSQIQAAEQQAQQSQQ
ncbi:spore coat protein YsxE [Ectobacillus sp. JY-23]|uniref:spore coat protein YsxE n=1 Tax=Ectobacillus sp. JY-23 TaxID=2933872 RepID=UPI001FF38638|nr:spore coat protein YsxE [Ectobacillus sp. JY-23]UOY94166.1 spore coat protein YsxE [Ectobacillus sp. JY-23]